MTRFIIPIILFSVNICIPFSIQGQNDSICPAMQSGFTLLQNGTFVDSITQKPFMVIPFENKSAEEIYNILMTNASIATIDPNQQISGVEFSLVKVRAPQFLLYHKMLGLDFIVNGTVGYEFQIKDGRVKVNAPYVEDPCHYGTTENICDFNYVVKGYFTKKGELKKKKEAIFNNLIQKQNNIIKIILGLEQGKKDEEDW